MSDVAAGVVTREEGRSSPPAERGDMARLAAEQTTEKSQAGNAGGGRRIAGRPITAQRRGYRGATGTTSVTGVLGTARQRQAVGEGAAA